MEEDKKKRAGLHKEISSIFDGVPIPSSNGTKRPSGASLSGRTGYADAKSPAQPPQNLSNPQAPTPHQPTQPFQKPAPVKQPELDLPKTGASDRRATIKTTNQETSWQHIKNKFFAPKSDVSTTRQKVMAVLVPVLSIVLIFVFIKVFSVPSRTIAKPPEVQPADTVAGIVDKIDWKIPTLYSTTYRDPMRLSSASTDQNEPEPQPEPPKLPSGKTEKLIVRSIVYTEDNPSAIIGNRIVHEGDKILDVTIVKISRDSVEFKMDNKNWIQKVERQM